MCSEKWISFLFMFFQVPGTFLLFLWVETWEANFLGIAEGEVSKAQDGNMGDGWPSPSWAIEQWYWPSCLQKCAYNSGVFHTTMWHTSKTFQWLVRLEMWKDSRIRRLMSRSLLRKNPVTRSNKQLLGVSEEVSLTYLEQGGVCTCMPCNFMSSVLGRAWWCVSWSRSVRWNAAFC